MTIGGFLVDWSCSGPKHWRHRRRDPDLSYCFPMSCFLSPHQLLIILPMSVHPILPCPQNWLSTYCYMRVPRSIQFQATYFLSAFWHGFYPGYYLTFMSVPLFQNLERAIKEKVGMPHLRQDAILHDTSHPRRHVDAHQSTHIPSSLVHRFLRPHPCVRRSRPVSRARPCGRPTPSSPS